MIKLSICIPTYNMAPFLRELLESILQQNPNPNELEICISDNASTDETEMLITDYQKKYPRLVYGRATKNLGYDLNCLRSVALAQGRYCWLMGADDCLSGGAIQKVYQLLQQNYDLILVNRLECNANLQPFYYRRWLGKGVESQIFDLKSDEDFVKYAMQANGLGAFFSYMGSLIFSHDKWNMVQDRCSDMIGDGYIHVGMILSFIHTERFLLYYFRDPLVRCRLGNHDFLRNDFARRTLLDLVGYEQAANILLHKQLPKYRAFLAVLNDEVTNSLNLRRILCAKFFSAASNYAFLQVYYRQLFGCSLRTKFKIVNFVYKVPWLNGLVKWLCLSAIQDKFGFKKFFLQVRWMFNSWRNRGNI